MAYCTTDEVLQRMGHSGATSADLNAKISDAITAAQVAIDGDTGRSFEATTRTITFGAEYDFELEVPDLISVTTLKVDDDDDGVFETTIAASGYELDMYHQAQAGWPYELVRLFDRSWPSAGKRRRRIEIVGSWGWSAVPAPINQAATLLALRTAQRPSAALFGVQSFGDVGASYVRKDDPDYMHLISQYMKPRIA
jgi:hypothetical protein